MSTLKTTYKELAIPHFKEVFEIIDAVPLEYAFSILKSFEYGLSQ